MDYEEIIEQPEEYEPEAKVDDFWKEILINYKDSEYPPRSWMWAWACFNVFPGVGTNDEGQPTLLLNPNVKQYMRGVRRGLRSSDIIKYLSKHKSDYLRFLFENKLHFNSHDRGYGFIFYTGSDEKRRAEEAIWKKFFYPPTRTKW